MPDGAPIAPGSGLGVATDEVPVNLTGTVSKNGTTTVAGVSTVFRTELSVGQVIRIPGGGGTEDRIVQAIASDTSLTVTVAFTNTAATQTGQRVQHAQLFKLAYSADGVATLVQVDANGVLVNTELPAAAALSDTTANPTAPMVGGGNMLWDGTQWVRARNSAAGGGSLPGTAGTSPAVMHMWDGGNYSPLVSGSALGDGVPGYNSIGVVAQIWNGTAYDKARGDVTNGLDVDVTRLPALVTGTATVGAVNVKPATSGGLSTFHLASAGSTNATNIKASAGQVFGWYIYNSNAAARKVAFHNTAGTPTAGASLHSSLVIPPTSAANVELSNGIAFGTGIAITTVTGLADNDTAAVAANDLIINIFYV